MIRLKIQAQKHVLVVARVKGLESLSDVGEEHLPILRTMHDVGLKWAQTFLKENESLVFRLGYHSVCGAFISFYYNFFKDEVYFDSDCGWFVCFRRLQ